MKRFRIGNDIIITWNVKKNGADAVLDGKTVSLYLSHLQGREIVKNPTVDGSSVRCTFAGLEQSILGPYTLTIEVRNEDESRYLIQDKCGVFELVSRTCAESSDASDYTITL